LQLVEMMMIMAMNMAKKRIMERKEKTRMKMMTMMIRMVI
jgi:hypothetical protein